MDEEEWVERVEAALFSSMMYYFMMECPAFFFFFQLAKDRHWTLTQVQ